MGFCTVGVVGSGRGLGVGLLDCFTAWRVGSISKGYPYSQPNRPTAKLPVPIGVVLDAHTVFFAVNDNR